MSSKHCLVFHGRCPDGAASAIVAKRIDRKTELVFGRHDHIDRQVIDAAKKTRKGGQLWIADICCSQEALDECSKILIEKGAKLGVYDHHISANWLSDYQPLEGLQAEIDFDLKRCGAKIFYDAMKVNHSDVLEDLDLFIELTQDRDLWLNKDPRSSELVSLHTLYGDENYINRFLENSEITFTERESTLLEHEKNTSNKRMYRLLNKMDIKIDDEGRKYGIVIGEGKASDILNAAIEKYDLEYACMVDFHSARASMRSRPSFDCAAFCKARGGGGHKQAAGFPISAPEFDLHSS